MRLMADMHSGAVAIFMISVRLTLPCPKAREGIVQIATRIGT